MTRTADSLRSRRPLCTGALLSALALTGCADPGEAPRPRVVGGFAHPEGVALAGERRFLSNIGAALEPLAHDGDGFISELDSAGDLVELRAFGPLDAPKGLAVLGDTLYAADIDRVVAFDLATRERRFEVPAPAAGALLNDLAVEREGALLVSDTLTGALYRLTVAERALREVATGLPGANGIAVDAAAGVAYVAGLGAMFEGGDLFAVPLAGGEAPRRLGTVHGLLDGVALAGGELLVSDWIALSPPVPGSLAAYDTAGAPLRELTPALPAPVRGPADFAHDPARDELWIPVTLDGTLAIVPRR